MLSLLSKHFYILCCQKILLTYAMTKQENMEMLQLKIFEKNLKLKYKQNKLKLDIDFLNSWKQLAVYPKSLIFKLPNVLNKAALSIQARLLLSATNKRNIELQLASKELSQSKTFLSKELSTINFCIFNRPITSYNKKSI